MLCISVYMVVEQIKLGSYHAAERLDPGPHTARFPAGISRLQASWVWTSLFLWQEWISLLRGSNKGTPTRCFGCELLLEAEMLGVQLSRSPSNWPSNTNIWTTKAKGEAGERLLARSPEFSFPSYFVKSKPLQSSSISFWVELLSGCPWKSCLLPALLREGAILRKRWMREFPLNLPVTSWPRVC